MMAPYLLRSRWAFFLGMLAITSCATTPLPNRPFVTQEYKLAVWPTFEQPVEFVLQKDSFGRAALFEYRFTGKGGYFHRHKGAPVVHSIEAEAWSAFMEEFSKASPWRIPVKQPYPTGTDGIYVILEMREGDRFHRVMRWTPFAHKGERAFVDATTAIVRLLNKDSSRD